MSYLTLEDMQNEFNLILLKNKLLNIGDDIDFKYLHNVGTLKKIVSGEAFLAGGKYKDKEPIAFYGKALFSGNDTPKMQDKSEGIIRRINILPMLNNFKTSKGMNEKCDVNILEKLKTPEVAEYCIVRAIEALKGVLNNKQLVKPKIVKTANTEFKISNDPILEFIEEKEEAITSKEAPTVYFVYYKNFCDECGYKPLGRNEFYKRMAAAGYIKQQVQSMTGRPYMLIKKDLADTENEADPN